MTEEAWNIIFILLSVPIFLVLQMIHRESRNRSIHATDDMVTTGLIREREEGELEIYRESLERSLAKIRKCENSIYRYVPSSDYPKQLKAVVSTQQAQELLDEFLRFYENEKMSIEDRQRILEGSLEEKKKRIQELNRGFRATDRALDVSALILRAVLVLVVFYIFVSLVAGLIS